MKKLIISMMALIALVFVCLGSISVRADNSGTQTKTVGNYTYTYYSQVIPNSGNIAFSTIVSSNKSTPSNYIGAYARLYLSNGSLVKSTSWIYAPTNLVTGSVYNTTNRSQYYYSKGKVGFYNGNGYTTYDCYSSPNVAPRALFNQKATVVKNNRGADLWI